MDYTLSAESGVFKTRNKRNEITRGKIIRNLWKCSVTAEVAGSSPVVPATHFSVFREWQNRLVEHSLIIEQVQKARHSLLFAHLAAQLWRSGFPASSQLPNCNR